MEDRTLGVNQRAREARLPGERWNRARRSPGWFWNVNESKWDEGERHLLKYIDVHGHATVVRMGLRGIPAGNVVCDPAS